MKTIFPGGTDYIVDDVVLTGDLDAGDVIVLPGERQSVLVKKVRLGQGGFILTVAPPASTRTKPSAAPTP
jgi:hypothetical protein